MYASVRTYPGNQGLADTLAEHEGTIWASAHLDWDGLAAQEQASALDRSGREDHRAPPIHSHEGGSRARQSE